jgi:hypothetical protein
MTCHGTGGCQQQGAKVSCDNSVASPGDGCGQAGAACSSDMKSALLCTSGKMTLAETCKGPGACKVGNGDIMCDNDVADLNDPCRDDGDYACTSDKSNALRCAGNKMGLINSCRGPKGCSVIHPKPKETDIDCDMSIAQENDPCAIPNNEACTLDKKTMLTCKGNKYTSPVACPGANGCTVTANAKTFKVVCDGEGGGAAPATPGGGKKKKK